MGKLDLVSLGDRQLGVGGDDLMTLVELVAALNGYSRTAEALPGGKDLAEQLWKLGVRVQKEGIGDPKPILPIPFKGTGLPDACPSCKGAGYFLVGNTGGNERRQRCNRCLGTGKKEKGL